MVETDPNNNQRWRIAFEDINDWNLAEGHRKYLDPNESLWATKQFGYDWTGTFRSLGKDGEGNGWTDSVQVNLVADPVRPQSAYKVRDTAGSDGFHDLRNDGGTPTSATRSSWSRSWARTTPASLAAA